MRIHQTKNLHSEEKQQQQKRQPTECEKISANHMSDKELIFRIYKELNNLIQKWAEDLNRHFFQEIYTWSIGT